MEDEIGSGGYQACPHCEGSKVCPDCGGNGTLYNYDNEGNAIPDSGISCYCTEYKAGKCRKCRSTGRFYPEMYDAPLPSRMDELNQTINQRDQSNEIDR